MTARNEDNTTLSLAEAAPARDAGFRLAIRWLTAGNAECSVLTGSPLTLGRSATVDIILDSSGVSRKHAELLRQGPVVAVRDLASRNGTFLNGRRVEHGALSDGDVLRLGDVVGVVDRVDPDRADERPTELGGTLFGPGLAEQLQQLRRIAHSELPVVIVGETGVGKERVARALHELSGRGGPFYAVNCAALPMAVAEAELFGHRKGAFTGAEVSGLGHLRAAEGGTLLLDELPELPLTLQAKLLRVLQEKEVTPLGETRPIPLDVRIACACQRTVDELVRAGRLRQDLGARLSGVMLEVPPLRDRRSDVGYLFAYFLRRLSGGRPPAVEPKLIERLLLYGWPNNVRELFLLTQRLLVLHGGEPLLEQEMLPECFGRSDDQAGLVSRGAPEPSAANREEHDRRALVAALDACAGNMSRAAAQAGISRQRAYRLMAARGVSAVSDENGDDHGSGG